MPKWRRDSIFGPGPRQPLDRNARARFRYLVHLHRAARRLPANALNVAEALPLRLLGENGRLDPSLAFLAEAVGCHLSTVVRSLARLRALGLLTWQRRLRRDAGTGWRCEQDTNGYLLIPEPADRPAACDTQNAQEVGLFSLKKKDAVKDAAARAVRITVHMLLAQGRSVRATDQDRAAYASAAEQLLQIGYADAARALLARAP